ncbi:Neurotrypsin [Camelus dromedarius]|uniref:Neurotrypsin n=1 Tax=Camelus dromedarius TaxID=9838 RepID=A0A5N4EHF5_CAMDR|nr:Neurotrypsin [Camelus dromedarius]
MLDEVRCTGNELSIEQCPKSSWGEHNCGHKEDAGVSCTPLTDGVIRLTGGKGSHEGRLEVYYRGQWGTVCDDGWTELNTYVVCRQLGFKDSSCMHSVYFIATDMANKPLQTTMKKAQGPYGWMTSAAQERKAVSFSVPGDRGEGMTAATGRTLVLPALPMVMDTDSLWVRTCYNFKAFQ